jgi:hypothetical protein
MSSKRVTKVTGSVLSPEEKGSTALIKDNQNDIGHPASSTDRIAEILAEGVYSYLKENGLLKEDFKKSQKIQELLEKTKRIDAPIDGEEMGSFKNN